MEYVDLTNQKFGLLQVIGDSKRRSSSGSVIWKCKCECGKETEVISLSLRQNKTNSCGCLRNTSVSLKHLKIIPINTEFDRWKVISNPKTVNKEVFYICECICGNSRLVRGVELRRGTTTSCGCRGRGSQTHGTIYGIYDKDDNLVYVGRTIRYKLKHRLDDHMIHGVGKLRKWLGTINYKPTIKPLIENVKIENLDMMEKQLIKVITRDYHSLLNVKYHSK